MKTQALRAALALLSIWLTAGQVVLGQEPPAEPHFDREHIQVEWDAPRMGFESFGSRERQTRHLAVSGQLSYSGAASAAPTWPECELHLVMARFADERPQWSRRFDWNRTLSRRTRPPIPADESSRVEFDFILKVRPMIAPDGRFVALVHPLELRRLVGESGEFQVGLRFKEVRIPLESSGYSGGGLLAQSVRMLEVPGPDPLRDMQSYINGSPSACAWCFEPVGLIRAVNRLHGLGFEGAIRELRDYASISQHSTFRPSTPCGTVSRSPDCAEHTRLFLICRLLFESKNSSASFPPMRAGLMAMRPGESFPLGQPYPLIVVKDVPFFVPEYLFGRSGLDPGPDAHLAWIVEHGKLRASPLVPPADPLSAVDELLSLEFEPAAGNDVQRQLWLSLEELTGMPLPESRRNEYYRMNPPGLRIGHGDWQRLRERVTELELYWDAPSQSYRSRTREREREAAAQDSESLRQTPGGAEQLGDE